MEITDKEKLEYLLSHGWETYGSNSYVKTEWLNDPRGHLSPNWYRTETLESAYNIEIGLIELRDEEKEMEAWLLNNGWEKSVSGYAKIKWINKNNPLSVKDAYLAGMAELNNSRR